MSSAALELALMFLRKNRKKIDKDVSPLLAHLGLRLPKLNKMITNVVEKMAA